MKTIHRRARVRAAIGFLVAAVVFQALSCTPGEESTTEEESLVWNGAAAFLAGVFTVANMEDLDKSGFEKNFRTNYRWIKDIFLPHLRETPKHDWKICDDYCIKMAERMANGDPEKEKQLREELSRFRHEDRETR
jgi:hypothetical protein